MEILLVCLGIFVLGAGGLVLFGIVLYNSLIKLKILVDEGWSGIDVQLKKRFDLLPNLVETVKGYAKHESQTFEKVAQLRSGMMSAGSPAELSKYEGELRSTLKTLFAVAESYPELKANENFLNLQGNLQTIEGDLESARRYYNGTVRNYNMQLQQFPNNIIAGILRFLPKEFFEIENAAERENVKVTF